jgi:hypothetical protein
LARPLLACRLARGRLGGGDELLNELLELGPQRRPSRPDLVANVPAAGSDAVRLVTSRWRLDASAAAFSTRSSAECIFSTYSARSSSFRVTAMKMGSW